MKELRGFGSQWYKLVGQEAFHQKKYMYIIWRKYFMSFKNYIRVFSSKEVTGETIALEIGFDIEKIEMVKYYFCCCC